MAGTWWQPPRLRVKEEDGERHATWLELFYDLIFVVAVAEVARNLDHNVSLNGFLQFIVLFIPVWWSWVGAAYYATRFDTDDTGHRLLTAVQMFAVAAMAVNARNGLGESSAWFALSYAAVRFILVIEYIRAGRYVPQARPLTKRYSRGFALAAAFWFFSALVPIPVRFIFWGIGILIDFGTPIFAGQLHVNIPPHASHLPERFGLFTIIVLGESVAAAVRGLAEQRWHTESAIIAALGLGIAFALWWVYFEGIGGTAIRSAVISQRTGVYQEWIYAHLLLAIGIAATGVGVEHVVKEALSPTLPNAERWLVCSALIMCFISLAIIHLSTTCPARTTRLQREAGATNLLIGAVAIFAIAIITAPLPPIVLITLLTIVCVVQVVLDFYEREKHSD